ncbi:GMC family oxidoreductase [Nocardia huaxiensis]|uniref:Cholesterol oxidase n=1 Tax=Nocardia huaxiensis TaxID=2755382 RepID=A0A7D6VFF2_9NOCA|nr:GMC family oxidoreductase [Nocardia huaxiensis]QLY28876.1 GMC family oxidoreductase [Nocardia huaxiensis]
MKAFDYDVMIVGSGFGGSVSALRLTEKGYRVAVLEAGRRFADHEFAETSWRVRRYLWAPYLGCYGITRMTLLRDTFLTAGAGVGGGSLVYGNTLYRPLDAFYSDPQWGHITDWKTELAPYFDQAERMLGVAEVPRETLSDELLREVAQDMGRGETYHRARVGVYFGENGTAPGASVPDPFFGGVGPARNTCLNCGECVVGCRHNAKNTTVKNYLYLAEKAGATVHPLTTVTGVRPLPGGGFRIETVRTGRWLRKERRVFTAEQVVFSAAALGTQRLLHKLRDTGMMPEISAALGTLTRTNSEAVLYPRSLRKDADYSKGVCITSSFHPDDETHVEAGRLGGPGSNLLGLTTTVLVDPEPGRPRIISGLVVALRSWRTLGRMHNPRRWSQQTIGLLVMQTSGNSLITYTRRGLFGRRMTTRPGPGPKPPVWIPAAHDVDRRIAEKIDGVPKGTTFDLFNIPSTGHFLGGCPIGDSPDAGVIDPYQRLYGYPGAHVIDGSAITANLGVNPSLTITAQAERAVALWPNKGDADPRPPLGAGYRLVHPVAPRSPVVPVEAPAALRLPIFPVEQARERAVSSDESRD